MSRFSDIHLSFYVYVCKKSQISLKYKLQTRPKKLSCFIQKSRYIEGFFKSKKKLARKLSVLHFFFQKKVWSGLTYDEQKRYLNRRKGVYAFVPCSSHCYSGTRKKILLYRLQFLKRNSSRRIVGDWEISCKQI